MKKKSNFRKGREKETHHQDGTSNIIQSSNDWAMNWPLNKLSTTTRGTSGKWQEARGAMFVLFSKHVQTGHKQHNPVTGTVPGERAP